MSPSSPELTLLPALCRLGRPLGVGIPVLSIVSRRATGVATLPSLSGSPSRKDAFDMDTEWEWECPDCPLIELRGRGMRPSMLLMDELG